MIRSPDTQNHATKMRSDLTTLIRKFFEKKNHKGNVEL